MRWIMATASVAFFLTTAVAEAAPYSDPRGFYTVELPDTWTVVSTSLTSGGAKLESSETALKGSSMMIGLAKRTSKPLEEDFRASGLGEVVSKTERDVAGVPCISSKQVTPVSEKLNFVMDRLWCALTVEHNGKTEDITFVLMSTGGDDAYAKQHQSFEALILSLKWGPTVAAGQR